MKGLKICPFCGREGKVIKWKDGLGDIITQYGCMVCEVLFETPEEWNQRVIMGGN